MRLLTHRDDGSLTFTDDLVRDIPQYAILSHTWGHDNQEVVFKDILEDTGRHKEGYRKIEFCCNRATSDSLQYFWVDTCCIDKSNSTELSEAINSMFRWYQNAVKCYVYLPDVSKNDVVCTIEPLRSTWKKEFRESRWFTRGWTLQELIAPSSVEFFASNGQRLGDKKSLEPLLHDITGIAISALRGSPLSDFTIDERMSWSKSRETKREEDRAYSLLGIFNVYMPLIYGEGEGKALSRLRREIDLQLGKPVLDKLPIVAGAAFDSHSEEHNPTCLPDTRVDLLREISGWVEDLEARAVFWLNGMAGTGKSTISRTLAQSFSKRGQLGASFFFKRGEGDRGGAFKFFTTIAAQLVRWEPALAPHVKDAIDNDPAIFEKALREQFEKLIFNPLLITSCSRVRKADALVIVIDALDECDQDEDVKLLIHLLCRANVLELPRLRIFLTSRPELPIRLGFNAAKSAYQDLILQEIEQPVIKHDLYVYFKHKLATIRKEYNNSVPQQQQLLSTWPEQPEILALTTMAVPLFIFAATACRFLAEFRTGSPDIKLRKILERQTKSQESKLDATYLPVLDQLLIDLSDPERNEVLELFKRLVGSIVLLLNPLPTSALARLLDIPRSTIDNQLIFLHSVLSIPLLPSSPVRLLHLSFRDFLIDPLKCGKNPYWVDEKATHKQLATCCIRVMNETLRTNICEVEWPGTPYVSINQRIVSDRLAPEVQYACQYWVYHVQEAGDPIPENGQIHRFLQQHFLHWLEALSLIGRALGSLQSIRTLQSLSQSEGCVQLSHFIDDALRFALANISTVQAAPLQIYSSALAFAPETSIIRQTFQSDVPDWMSLCSRVTTHWSNCLQTLEGHGRPIWSVAFSPDGKVIASGSDDKTVRLWSAATGVLQHTQEGHGGAVRSVAFSPNSMVVASGSDDKTVRLWSAVTGVLQHTFEGHSRSVWSVMFSPNGKIIASGSYDKTVQLWSAVTGTLQHTLKSHRSYVNSVAFSPDGKVIASGSDDKTVRLWLAATGALQHTLEGHGGAVRSVAFSPNSMVVASGSDDKTVRLWSAVTGVLQYTLKSHGSGVTSVTFSLDGQVIASGSYDKTIRLWSAVTGALQYTLEGHGRSVWSVTFSPNGRIVASGSYDKTVRLWSAVTGALQHMFKNHGSYINSVTFSPNGKIVGSGSYDKTVQLWSAATGVLQHTLEGHSSAVRSVAFSPNSMVVASGSDDKTVRLWSAVTGALQYTFEGHSCSVWSVTFSFNGRIVASSSDDKTVRLWSADTGALQHILEGHGGYVNSVAFSFDGRVVASASTDDTVRLWSAATGDCLQSIHLGTTNRLSFDRDGKYLLTDVGAISLDHLPQPAVTAEATIPRCSVTSSVKSLPDHDQHHRMEYGISADRCWVTLNGKNLFWLPTDCRPGCSAVFGSTVAIGSDLGRIVIMRFSIEEPAGL